MAQYLVPAQRTPWYIVVLYCHCNTIVQPSNNMSTTLWLKNGPVLYFQINSTNKTWRMHESCMSHAWLTMCSLIFEAHDSSCTNWPLTASRMTDSREFPVYLLLLSGIQQTVVDEATDEWRFVSMVLLIWQRLWNFRMMNCTMGFSIQQYSGIFSVWNFLPRYKTMVLLHCISVTAKIPPESIAVKYRDAFIVVILGGIFTMTKITFKSTMVFFIS